MVCCLIMRPADPKILKIERQLLEYFKQQMPDYRIEVGEGDFDSKASSFIFDKGDNRTILYLHHGLVSQAYDEVVKGLAKFSWQTDVQDNPGHKVWLKRHPADPFLNPCTETSNSCVRSC